MCSIIHDQRSFAIAKVIAREPGEVHVRIFKEKFGWRPERIDTSALSLGTIFDDDGFGMGHTPLSDAAFGAWGPVRIHNEPVTTDETEGYEMWREAGGSLWP